MRTQTSRRDFAGLEYAENGGREVLAKLKGHENLKTIPVVVLTTSDADEDIVKSYGLGLQLLCDQTSRVRTVFKGYSINREFLVYHCKAAI